MKSKMLIIIDFPQNSIYIQSIAYALKKNGFDVSFLFFCEPGELSKELILKNLTCYFKPLKGNLFQKTLKGLFAIRQLQRQTNFDVIFSHLALPNLIASFFQLIDRKTKICVCRHHSDMNYQENIKNGIRLDKITQTLAKNIVVISEKSKEVMIQQDKCEPNKITFLPLLYDFSLYGHFNEFSPVRNSIQLVFVSRLVELKKIQTIFPVIERLKKKNNGWSPFHISIVGDGPYEDTLRHLVQQHRLVEEVEFKGFLNDPMSEINNSDILVLLSSSESSNQVVKEAGILGKTVIACKTVGDFDTYLNEDNSFLLNVDFTDLELEQVLQKIITDKKILRTKGMKLKQIVIDKFSIENHFYKYLNYFNK
jgi:glycosyltransferase involved in cell wall biosynthesis